MKSILLLAASFILLASSCKKNKPTEPVKKLPTETQTGANTFGCKINGDIFLSQEFGNCFNNIQFYKTDSTLSLGVYETCGKNFQINLRGVSAAKDYIIGSPMNNAYRYRTSQSSCSLYDLTNSAQSGTVTITKCDLTNKIISGRFSGILRQTGCPDVTITEGRFDFQMIVFN